jgi:hypothetical protein
MSKTTENNTGLKDTQDDVGRSLRDYISLTLTGLINSLYLVLWAAIQWFTNRLLERYTLIGMDAVVLAIFQVLFAITTVIAPCLYIYRDIRIAVLKMNGQIENEVKRSRRK